LRCHHLVGVGDFTVAIDITYAAPVVCPPGVFDGVDDYINDFVTT
jgi:hypothetical protein